MLSELTLSRERGLDEGLDFEALLVNLTSRMVNSPYDQLDREIGEAFRAVGEALALAQSTIYLRQAGNDAFALRYVLRDPELLPLLTNESEAAEAFPWSTKKAAANKLVDLPDIETATPETSVDSAMSRKYGIRSALVIPLSTGGRPPLGFWSVYSTSENRDWPQHLRNRLQILANAFANNLERAETERRLRESEARLKLAANTTGAGLWTVDLDTGTIWATAKLAELFGVRPDEVIDTRRFFGIVHSEDREKMRRVYASMVAGHEETIEYRIVPAAGSLRWVMSRGNRYESAPGRSSILMGVTLDITERRATEEALRGVSGRLLQAQEDERRRIARELHDGIGQRVAMVAIGIQQLSADNKLASARRNLISQLGQETMNLSSEVQALSHGLHSPQLDYLGLEAAIEALCQELRTGNRVEIDFTHVHVPRPLPPDVALALFRITQEGLQNALKHSGVKRFSVTLEGAPTHIELTIRDSGAGFDVKKATHGCGLGLISMRERALALNGSVKVRSQAGHGTEIFVRVPVSSTGRRAPALAS